MLQVAGVSVAMGSAPPDVQAAASFVVPSNAEDGAYHEEEGRFAVGPCSTDLLGQGRG
jgi:hypothetical protein